MSRTLPLDRIGPNPKKRYSPAEIDRMAETISTTGSVNPIVVRPTGERFQIVNGGLRYQAVKQLGWTTIPAKIDLPPDPLLTELTQTLNEPNNDALIRAFVEDEYYR